MVIIDLSFFGFSINENIELSARNIALLAAFTGAILRILFRHISLRTEETPFFDIFFGTGFTDMIAKLDFTWLISPFKELVFLRGSLFELIIGLLGGYTFYLFAEPIETLAVFQNFVLGALVTGYSAQEIANNLIETIQTRVKHRTLLNMLASKLGTQEV
ncbi:MAG: hypothetical protein ACTSYA_04940 [Candidatus Kariarchaeaceae archaeon]